MKVRRDTQELFMIFLKTALQMKVSAHLKLSCLSQSPDILFQSLPKTMVMFICTKLIWPGCTTLLAQCIKVSQSLDLSNWIFNKMSVNTSPLTRWHGMWPVGGPRTRGLCSCWWYFQKPESFSSDWVTDLSRGGATYSHNLTLCCSRFSLLTLCVSPPSLPDAPISLQALPWLHIQQQGMELLGARVLVKEHIFLMRLFS